jgi:hypothetical protein
VVAVGAGVEADCGTTFSTAVTCVEMAEPPNFSCMAMMASLTPAGVMSWAEAISAYVLPSRYRSRRKVRFLSVVGREEMNASASAGEMVGGRLKS